MAGFDVANRAGRLAATLDYLWNDHAYLRLGFSNAHWISPELARANQPWPFQLKRWRRQGVRTVVNLRGGFDASFYALERAACERLGLTLVDFTVTSREAPTRAQVEGAVRLFETIEYPAMMHCKSGADRAGLMAVLYAHFRQGEPIRTAIRHLSPRYLHVRAGLTGVLDFVFERYLETAEPAGVGFLEWVRSSAYDPAALKAEFRASWWGNVLTERLLRRE
ncbi:MAG TPA: sulfur transferase domain-containing protein [Caulobacteraceae bacterium]|nr:sulfur transferase domain-containing protein [Caulobacteraceae bacterium]